MGNYTSTHSQRPGLCGHCSALLVPVATCLVALAACGLEPDPGDGITETPQKPSTQGLAAEVLPDVDHLLHWAQWLSWLDWFDEMLGLLHPELEEGPVSISPIELTFYGDLSGPELPPKQVVVSNESAETVHLILIEVQAAGDMDPATPGAVDAFGGSEYFTVEVADGDTDLAPGEELTINVSMLRVSTQSAGVLVVETDHPAYPFLTVSLRGKYFNW